MLTGCGKYLENLVRERLGIKVRSVELNLCQRCSIFSQSLTDAREAALAGSSAVEAALKGESGKMVSFVRTSDDSGKPGDPDEERTAGLCVPPLTIMFLTQKTPRISRPRSFLHILNQ